MSSIDDLRLTRSDIVTILAVDLAWAMSDEAESAFLRDRGRPSWLKDLVDSFIDGSTRYAAPQIVPPAYAASSEFGRPTFGESFAASYMPLVFECLDPIEQVESDTIAWRIARVEVGPTGAVSLEVRAHLSRSRQSISVPELVSSYHEYRRSLRSTIGDSLAEFCEHWSNSLPRYRVDQSRVDRLSGHLEIYDVVDFDYEVASQTRRPKDIYESGPLEAVQALAGITRMSHVMATYGPETAARLRAEDLGNRPDELWIANAERLSRHHPEHNSDVNKRLFFDDVVGAIEILLQEAATLAYVGDWVREVRATFLDQLTVDDRPQAAHAVMRQLLRKLAWASDLFAETISVDRDSGSSFFRAVTANVSAHRGIEARRGEVVESVGSLLALAEAVFSEQTAAISLKIDRAAKNIGWAALIIAIVALLATGIQLYGALSSETEQDVCVVSSQSVEDALERAPDTGGSRSDSVLVICRP